MDTRKWWQKPMTLYALQKGSGNDAKEVLDDCVVPFHYTGEQLAHVLSDGMKFFREEADGANLDKYLKLAKEKDIKQIIYYNVHCYNNDIAEKHPDWWMRVKDGSPRFFYNTYYANCINIEGTWFEDYSKNITDLCSHDIDGIFLDGPIWPSDCCYCETCKKTFEKIYNKSIYDATRLEMQEFRIERVTDFMRETYNLVKSLKPEIPLYLNNSALRADVIGTNARKLYPYVDILGAEAGFTLSNLEPYRLWQIPAFAKHLSAIAGNKNEKPSINFFASNQSGISKFRHTEQELRLCYIRTIANGQSVWYGLHENILPHKRNNTFEWKKEESIKELNKLFMDNASIFDNTLPCSKLAIVWSQYTANNYGSTVMASDFTDQAESKTIDRGDSLRAFVSLIDILERNHIQFDIIDEKNITDGDMKNYQAVIFPQVACFDDELVASIKSYVEDGGVILGNYDIGMYNELGEKLSKNPLDEVFGFKNLIKCHSGPTGRAALLKNDTSDLISKVDEDYFPAPSLSLEYEYDSDVECLMKSTYPSTGVYARVTDEQYYNAITKHPYGKGYAYYFSGNYLETTHDKTITTYSDIIRNFVKQNTEEVVVSDDAGLYEMVLRKQENRFVLHIINLTGAMQRPIKKLVPLCDLEVKLNLSGFGIDKKEFALKTILNSNLKDVKVDGYNISFKLDKLSEYEIIVIE